ncbi:ankyrin repeat domain-containing protein [Dechloromonas sp. H13]|uniref:ankyrin repeat domain-containing protein n=1 Tax=Dechloromonas sp. H13 TaxID=2570193 RepID=UPI001D18CFDA|nr:ankyrin repeat domain-containing protein [Dechloromonas sp. H13]
MLMAKLRNRYNIGARVMSSAYSVDELRNKSAAWLLAQRGLGGKHNGETHARIEAEMRQRGLHVPPLPEFPVMINTGMLAGFIRGGRVVGIVLAVVICWLLTQVAVVAMKAGEPIIWVSVTVIAFLVYLVIYFLRREKGDEALTAEQQQALSKGKRDGVSQLMIVAAGGNARRVTDLLNYGTEVNARTKSGNTALMYAAANGHADIYRLLLSYGADELEKNVKGQTACDIARCNGHAIPLATVATYS